MSIHFDCPGKADDDEGIEVHDSQDHEEMIEFYPDTEDIHFNHISASQLISDVQQGDASWSTHVTAILSNGTLNPSTFNPSESAPNKSAPVPWPWKLLAPLLAALMLAGAKLNLNWSLDDAFPTLGSVAASLEALKDSPLAAWAGQGKAAGFAGGVVMGAYDLVNIYQSANAAGQSTVEIGTKGVASLVIDGVGFVTGAAIMDFAIAGLAGSTATLGIAGPPLVVAGAATANVLLGKGLSVVKQFTLNTIDGFFAANK